MPSVDIDSDIGRQSARRHGADLRYVTTGTDRPKDFFSFRPDGGRFPTVTTLLGYLGQP